MILFEAKAKKLICPLCSIFHFSRGYVFLSTKGFIINISGIKYIKRTINIIIKYIKRTNNIIIKYIKYS